MLGLPSMLPPLSLHYCPSFNYPVPEPGDQMSQCVQDSCSANQITTHDVRVCISYMYVNNVAKGVQEMENTTVIILQVPSAMNV